jgi:hypothetical protein
VTGPDDRSGGTDPGATLDAVVERCLQGQATGDAPAFLATFLDDVRVATGGPPPPPSAALEALLSGAEAPHEAPAGPRGALAERASRRRGRLRHGPAAGPARQPRRARGVRLAQRLAAAGLAGKAVLALALGGTAAAGACAAGVLPDPVDAVVRRVIELVTPFELPNDAFARLDGDDSARPTADGPGHVHPAGGDRTLSEPGTTADHAADLAEVTGESPSSDPVAGASAPVFDEAPVTVAAPSATQTGQPAPPTTTTTTTADDPPQTQPPVTGEVAAGPGANGSGGAGGGGPATGAPRTVPGQGPGSVGAVPGPPPGPVSAPGPVGEPTSSSSGSVSGSRGPGSGSVSGSRGPGSGSVSGSRGEDSGSASGSHGPGSGSVSGSRGPGSGSVSGKRGQGSGSARASRGPDGGSQPPSPASHPVASDPPSRGFGGLISSRSGRARLTAA